MKIRKFILFITVTVGLIGSSLPVSFAFKEDIPVITTDMTQPELSYTSSYMSFCYCGWDHIYEGQTGAYTVSKMICRYEDSSAQFIIGEGNIFSTVPFTLEQDLFHPITGKLSQVVNYNSVRMPSPIRDYYWYRVTTFYASYSHTNDGLYCLVPENVIIGGTFQDQSNHFISFAADLPDQVSYKSPLSEPVADQYNSYAVLDDHLIWVSYRVNAMYSANNQIESSSQVFSSIGSYSESGTGNYAGQQNGYTEDVSLPDGEFIGASQSGSGGTTLYSGGYSGFDFGNIDFSGVNSGNVHFNSNGSVTYNDVEYRPISFSQSDILSYFRLYCIPTASDNFVFWLAPDHSFTNDILINMDFFFSEFDLDGNYIRSSFNQVTSTELGLFDSYSPEDPVSSVRFYGIDFYNLNNLPLNLSSVLWQYDFEFSAWRDSMLSMLTAIYNTLQSDQNVPETPTTANWGQEVHDMEPTSTISNDEVISIYDNVGEINSSLSDSSDSLHSLVDMFSIGKLIGLVAFALSIGTAILILGKKKSE